MKVITNHFMGAAILAVLTLGACKIPQDTILFASNSSISNDKHISSIPDAWDNRFLRFVDNPNKPEVVLGGDSLHHHGIVHTHQALSTGTTNTISPFGIATKVSSENHTHLVRSISQTPEISSDEAYNPYHQDLLAYVVTKDMPSIPAGLIVAYTGQDVPAGWLACNGQNGTLNLDSVYINLRKSNADKSPTGNNMHQHNIQHQHSWSVASPDPNDARGEALAGDKTAYPSDVVKVNGFTHNHNVVSTWSGPVLTDAELIFPPSVKLRFIQSRADAKAIPKGAVLPFTGREIPAGWRNFNNPNVSGRFLFGVMDASAVFKTFGSLTHQHSYTHTHNLQLTPMPTTTDVRGVTAEKNLPVSVLMHTHNLNITDTEKTDPSAALPRWIAFNFIIKK